MAVKTYENEIKEEEIITPSLGKGEFMDAPKVVSRGYSLDPAGVEGQGGYNISTSVGEDIQRAIDVVNEKGGGTVYLKPGTHLIASDLILYSGIYLQGISANKTIIDFQSGAYQIKVLGSNNYSTGTLTVANGATTVEGAGVTWASTMAGRSIMLGGIWYPIASVTDADTLEIAVPYAGEALAGDTYVMATLANSVKLVDLTIKNSTTSAIKVQYATEFFLRDIDIQVCANALDMDDCSNTTIEQTDITYTTSDSIQLNNVHFTDFISVGAVDSLASGMVLNGCTNIAMRADFVLNSATDGMNLTDCDNIGILSSACTENGSNGIELVSGNTNISMLNMGCFSNGSDGIKMTGTDDRNIVMGCFLEDNGGYGLNIASADCDDNVILNNVYNSNTSGEINDAGTGTVTSGAQIYEVSASDILRASADTERSNADAGYTMHKEIKVQFGGVVRVEFDMKGGIVWSSYGRIYVNGVASGTERVTSLTTYTTYGPEDISISAGDLVQLYTYSSVPPNAVVIRNFRLYWDKNPVADYTVNTD